MVKPLPNTETAQAEALEVLRESLGRFGEILEHQWVRRCKGTLFDPGIDLKLRFEVTKGQARGSTWWIHALIKHVVYPKQATEAIWSLKRSVEKSVGGDPVYPILIAPFISESVAQRCEEEQIGYLDLAGNGNLEFGGIWIHRQGIPRKYKELRPQKSLFTPKASRILRVLLQGPLRAYKVEELAQAANVSLGLVSKVRKLLLDQELVVETQDGIALSQPDALLDAWVKADDWAKRTEVREYSLLPHHPPEVAAQVAKLLEGKKHAFTQWFGAFLRQPYTLPVLTTMYVEDFPDEEVLKKELGARRVESGGRLRLVRPVDEGVFQCLQEIQGKKVVCDVQLYLDVIAAGLRGDEAASELRKAKDFSGGWK